MALYAQAGDIYFTRGDSGLAKLIRWAETEPGEAPTWTNHVGAIVRQGYLIPPPGQDIAATQLAQSIEALWHVQYGYWWELHGNDVGVEVEVWRNLRQRSDGTARERRELLSHVGERYAWWRLLGFLGRRFTKVDFPKYFRLEHRNVCSTLVCLGKEAAGIHFSKRAAEMTPDMMRDECQATVQWLEAGRGVVGDRRKR